MSLPHAKSCYNPVVSVTQKKDRNRTWALKFISLPAADNDDPPPGLAAAVLSILQDLSQGQLALLPGLGNPQVRWHTAVFGCLKNRTSLLTPAPARCALQAVAAAEAAGGGALPPQGGAAPAAEVGVVDGMA